MRFSVIAVAAILMLPLAAPASACSGAKAQAPMAQVATTDYSAAAKKRPARKPKVKVEYMRAAPM